MTVKQLADNLSVSKTAFQAAIGAVPLAVGLPCGNIILSVAVLAIVVTAPLGAIGIDCSYRKLLNDKGCML